MHKRPHKDANHSFNKEPRIDSVGRKEGRSMDPRLVKEILEWTHVAGPAVWTKQMYPNTAVTSVHHRHLPRSSTEA